MRTAAFCNFISIKTFFMKLARSVINFVFCCHPKPSLNVRFGSFTNLIF